MYATQSVYILPITRYDKILWLWYWYGYDDDDGTTEKDREYFNIRVIQN